ncbi:hypothetical protein HanRHA438_Chr17g0817181 [Helianthus annuus]|nr:hypothetical protein HanRHA438_Chr17g0817181 [Helianthus annuus]
MYITAYEIYDYINMYIYKKFQKPQQLIIKDKAPVYVSIINLDSFIKNLSPISISNIILFDHLPRNSSNNNKWKPIKLGHHQKYKNY